MTIYLVLVACFFVQTGFVYFDENHDQRLSDQAREGLALWRENNCHTCHQLHGFGGFLGPDLTNVLSRRPHEDWTAILTEGRKQMPAFEFDEAERDAIVAFLAEMDATGTSIPRFTELREGVVADRLVRDYADATGAEVPAEVLRGEGLVEANRCNTCHWPFATGIQGAPDATTVMTQRPHDAAVEALRHGKGSMPSYDFLADEDLDAILASWEWMSRNRRALGLHHSKKEHGDTFDWAAVPWFEY